MIVSPSVVSEAAKRMAPRLRPVIRNATSRSGTVVARSITKVSARGAILVGGTVDAERETRVRATKAGKRACMDSSGCDG
jgi:hypothetical protein